MLGNLDCDKNFHYGIDLTHKMIQNSYKPYKLMTIYTILKISNIQKLSAFICIKYEDY